MGILICKEAENKDKIAKHYLRPFPRGHRFDFYAPKKYDDYESEKEHFVKSSKTDPRATTYHYYHVAVKNTNVLFLLSLFFFFTRRRPK